jgi:hypothetical protein
MREWAQSIRHFPSKNLRRSLSDSCSQIYPRLPICCSPRGSTPQYCLEPGPDIAAIHRSAAVATPGPFATIAQAHVEEGACCAALEVIRRLKALAMRCVGAVGSGALADLSADGSGEFGRGHYAEGNVAANSVDVSVCWEVVEHVMCCTGTRSRASPPVEQNSANSMHFSADISKFSEDGIQSIHHDWGQRCSRL